jgi:hypothetical protein
MMLLQSRPYRGQETAAMRPYSFGAMCWFGGMCWQPAGALQVF